MKNYSYYITPEEYAAAERNGINKTNLESRIRARGWDHERAINQPLKKQRRHPWLSVAKMNGISRELYHSRIRSNWSEERAATEPIHTNHIKDLIEINRANRKYSQEMIDLAASNGISYGTFCARMNRKGMTQLKAATMPLMTKAEAGSIGRRRKKQG